MMLQKFILKNGDYELTSVAGSATNGETYIHTVTDHPYLWNNLFLLYIITATVIRVFLKRESAIRTSERR